MARWYQRAGNQRGQALVEFALMTPVLLILIAGIVEAGRAFATFIQIANAAREGARVGSVTPSNTSSIQSAALRELPSWIAAEPTTVSVSCAAAGASSFDNCVTVYPPASGDQLKVTVSYNYQPIMPVLNGITTITAVQIASSTVMQVQ